MEVHSYVIAVLENFLPMFSFRGFFLEFGSEKVSRSVSREILVVVVVGDATNFHILASPRTLKILIYVSALIESRRSNDDYNLIDHRILNGR